MSTAKRTAAALIALACTGLVLTGCGGSDEPTAAVSASAAPAGSGPQVLLDRQRLTALDQPMAFPKGKQRTPSVTSRILSLEPGQQTEPVLYKAPTYVYVLEGQYTVEYAAGVTKVYEAGTAYMEGLNTTVTGKNASSDLTRVMIVQFGSAKR